jgi:hypothetical protein
MTTTITQVPSYTADRFDLARTTFGGKITLKAETFLFLYLISGSPEEFKAYYKETITPWLDEKYTTWLADQKKKPEYDPGAQYPIAIYLLGSILLVLTTKDNNQPWEDIQELQEHVKQLNAERLEWFPPKAAENQPKASENSPKAKAPENPPKARDNHAA